MKRPAPGLPSVASWLESWIVRCWTVLVCVQHRMPQGGKEPTVMASVTPSVDLIHLGNGHFQGHDRGGDPAAG